MKKTFFLILGVLVVSVFSGTISRAEETEKPMGMMNKEMMKEKGMMGKGMMGGKGMMAGKMMNSMMERSVVATSDGGIVIVFGNKIIKYDKNLNFVKEAELKMDMAGMQKMMPQKECCGMMGGKKGQAMESGDDQKELSPSEHESHH